MSFLKNLARKILKSELESFKREIVRHLSSLAFYERSLDSLQQEVIEQQLAILGHNALMTSLRQETKTYYDLAQTYKAQAEANHEQPKPPPRELSQFNPKQVTVEDLKRQFYGGLFAIPGLEITELKPNKTYNTYLITLPAGHKIREFFVKENLGSDSQNPRLTITEVLK
jgi:uncharacterized membrane-anchored protein YhcB (DUF1043 family)